jgi:hypothetical protein
MMPTRIGFALGVDFAFDVTAVRATGLAVMDNSFFGARPTPSRRNLFARPARPALWTLRSNLPGATTLVKVS